MGTSSEGQRKQLERFVASQTGVSPELEEKEFFEKGNWENVTGHCLLEAARACVFADLLGFDADLKKDLAIAALLHDGYKRREIIAIQEEVKSGGSG
ncbi:MAG: hypothetical protein Q8P49_01700, partial [Candidatus Liptonbacteria bacterium]|nr:hypothetical protein [Candidatus Liptonbacteria bacterium]